MRVYEKDHRFRQPVVLFWVEILCVVTKFLECDKKMWENYEKIRDK